MSVLSDEDEDVKVDAVVQYVIREDQEDVDAFENMEALLLLVRAGTTRCML